MGIYIVKEKRIKNLIQENEPLEISDFEHLKNNKTFRKKMLKHFKCDCFDCIDLGYNKWLIIWNQCLDDVLELNDINILNSENYYVIA